MIIFPAIDLKQGHCVRLEKGDMNKATIFNADPVAQVETFLAQGFDHLHLIDLDGATSEGDNKKIIEEILCSKKLKTQIGGGVRSLAQIEKWLALGAARVIVGTLALLEPIVARAACKKFPGKIVIALDGVQQGQDFKVALQGWKKISEENLTDAAERIKDWGAASILFTDIARDGMGQGINLEATLGLAADCALPILASGGLKNIDDVKKLTGQKNIEGVIAGRALYDGVLDGAAALAWVRDHA